MDSYMGGLTEQQIYRGFTETKPPGLSASDLRYTHLVETVDVMLVEDPGGMIGVLGFKLFHFVLPR